MRESHRVWLAGSLAVLCTLAALSPSIRNGFVAWDDDINVYENPLLNPVTPRSLSTVWKGPYLRLYIPLAYTFWTGAAWLQERRAPGAPLRPRAFHLLNLALHLLSVAAVFALLRLLLRPRQPPAKGRKEAQPPPASPDWAAACGALLFGLHPLQVEPVVWISGLRDVLSGLGAALALQQYAAFAASEGRRRVAHYLSATLALAAALLSKPSAVVIPLLAGILDYGVLGRGPRRVAASLWPWLLLALASALVTQSVQGATHIRALVPLWDRPLVALDSLAFYLYKLILPAGLSPDYGRAPDLVLRKGWLYYTWLAPAALGLGVWLWRPARRIGGVCCALFVAAALPVLGFVPFLHQDLSTVADRYVYLSMIGPALALAWALVQAPRWAWVACGAGLTALGTLSFAQARVWRDTGSLFGRIVALNPDSGVAHLNLGNFLAGEGKLEEARAHFMETLRLRPGDGLAHNNLGNLFARQGKLEEAIAHFSETLRSGVPDNVADAHNALGVLYSRQGKGEEAQRHYLAALKINPNREGTHLNLGLLLAQQGKPAEAEAHLRWALQLKPGFAQARKDLAFVLAEAGRLKEANEEMARGLAIPADSVDSWAVLGDNLLLRERLTPAVACYREVLKKAPALAEAHNSLGYALARQGRADEAIAQYREAVRLNPKLRQAQFNLGTSLLSRGRLDEAISAMSRAVSEVPDAAEIQHNLGVALLQKGDKSGARAHLEAALKLRPDFEPSLRALREIR